MRISRTNYCARSAELPQYYFHLFNDEVLRDDTGQDLPDVSSARDAALQGISELIAEHLAAGKTVDLGHRIDVEDEAGRVATRVVFKDLFVYRGEPLTEAGNRLSC